MPFGHRTEPFALDVNIEEIGSSFYHGTLGAIECALECRRLLDRLTLDAECARGLHIIHVGIAKVASHVSAGLELPAGAVPNAIALVVVAVVVEHDHGDRRLVPRHGPQRLRPAEAEAAVTNDGNHRDVGPGE